MPWWGYRSQEEERVERSLSLSDRWRAMRADARRWALENPERSWRDFARDYVNFVGGAHPMYKLPLKALPDYFKGSPGASYMDEVNRVWAETHGTKEEGWPGVPAIAREYARQRRGNFRDVNPGVWRRWLANPRNRGVANALRKAAESTPRGQRAKLQSIGRLLRGRGAGIRAGYRAGGYRRAGAARSRFASRVTRYRRYGRASYRRRY